MGNLLFKHGHALPKIFARPQGSYDNVVLHDKMNLMALHFLWFRKKTMKLLKVVTDTHKRIKFRDSRSQKANFNEIFHYSCAVCDHYNLQNCSQLHLCKIIWPFHTYYHHPIFFQGFIPREKKIDEMPYNAVIPILIADATSGSPSSRLQKGIE